MRLPLQWILKVSSPERPMTRLHTLSFPSPPVICERWRIQNFGMQEAILCSQTYSTHSSFLRQEGPKPLKKHFVLPKYYKRLLVFYHLNIPIICLVLSLYKLKIFWFFSFLLRIRAHCICCASMLYWWWAKGWIAPWKKNIPKKGYFSWCDG